MALMLQQQENYTPHRRAFSINELAKQWGVHPNTVRKLTKNGSLKSFRAGRQILVDEAGIAYFERSHAATTA